MSASGQKQTFRKRNRHVRLTLESTFAATVGMFALCQWRTLAKGFADMIRSDF